MRRAIALLALWVASAPACVAAQTVPWTRPALAAPVADGRWVRPATADGPAEPVWGHADGLRVGLAPLPGPRGLLRVYAPYVGHEAHRMINFIAVEPIPAGQTRRGLSELEPSRLDGVAGKRFWSVEAPSDATPRPADRPVRGTIEQVDGVEALVVHVQVEPFDNGAHVSVRLTFRADRPHEVGVAAFAHADSVPLRHCALTATMGNYARLRELHLADRVVRSTALWPDYRGDGFTPHARFPLDQLARTPEGHATAAATPDEPDPALSAYAPGVRSHWHYRGAPARQTWRCEAPQPGLEVWVNGRHTYWRSRAPIPGGVAYENFEMVSPFRPGETFWFGVEPTSRDDGTGYQSRPKKNATTP